MLAGGEGHFNSSEVASFTMEQAGCWDIVINNLDVGLDHPYHLRKSLTLHQPRVQCLTRCVGL